MKSAVYQLENEMLGTNDEESCLQWPQGLMVHNASDGIRICNILTADRTKCITISEVGASAHLEGGQIRR